MIKDPAISSDPNRCVLESKVWDLLYYAKNIDVLIPGQPVVARFHDHNTGSEYRVTVKKLTGFWAWLSKVLDD